MTQKDLPLTVSYLFIGLIFVLFLLYVYPYSNPFPFSDDWTYPNILGTGWINSLSWLFALHNDHRIPVMKLVQYLTLRETSFDFRALIFINGIVATTGCVSFLFVARNYRGRSHIGDIIIPMVLLNPAAGFFGWGFSAQFLLSVSSSMVAVLYLQKPPSWRSSTVATLALAICALSGMNGVVLSAIISISFLFFHVFGEKRKATWVGHVFIIALCIVLLTTWTPSVASVSPTQTSKAQILNWLYQYSKSSFIVSAFHGGWWRASLCIALALGAVALAVPPIFRSFRGIKLPPSDFAVYAAIAAYMALFFSVVIGRSAHGPWSPGLEMHYGYLAAPIPLMSWIVVSRYLPRHGTSVLALILVTVYAQAFVENAGWRRTYLLSRYALYEKIGADLHSDMPAASIAEKHIKIFYHVDTPDVQQQVTQGIIKLRQFGGPFTEVRDTDVDVPGIVDKALSLRAIYKRGSFCQHHGSAGCSA